MALKIQKHLLDIQTSIDSIYEYLGEQRNFDFYLTNRRSSITRELKTVCESVSEIIQQNPDITISNARKIVSLCNCIIHVHDSVDNKTVWDIVINHLPKLKDDVDKLLMD